MIMLILYWSVSAKLASSSAELDNKTKELASLNPLRDCDASFNREKGKVEGRTGFLSSVAHQREYGPRQDIRRSQALRS